MLLFGIQRCPEWGHATYITPFRTQGEVGWNGRRIRRSVGRRAQEDTGEARRSTGVTMRGPPKVGYNGEKIVLGKAVERKGAEAPAKGEDP